MTTQNKAQKTIFAKHQESLKQFEKFKEEQERIEAQVLAVKNQTHLSFGEFVIEKAENDENAKQLLKEFLSTMAKTKDKDTKAYVEILAEKIH